MAENTEQNLEVDLESIPDTLPVEDVKGLKSTLAKFKEMAAEEKKRAEELIASKSELEKTLETFNPEEYQRLKAQEQESAKLRDELAKLRVTIQTEFEREYEEKFKLERETRTQAEQRFIELNRKSDNSRYFAEAGGIGKHFASFDKLIQEYLEHNDDGTIKRVVDEKKNPRYVTDDKDKKAREITPTEFYLECRQGKHGPILQNCFEPYNKASGSGFNAGGAGSDGFIYVQKSEMSTFMAGNGDPTKARENTRLVKDGKVRWI